MADQHPSNSSDKTPPWVPYIAVLDAETPQDPCNLLRLFGAAANRNAKRSLTDWRRLSAAFFDVASRFEEQPALVTKRHTTIYAEIALHAIRVSHHLLHQARYQSGDRVAVLLDNGPEFVAAYYGILAAGGVVVPLPANVEWSRLERIARICNIQTVLSNRRIVKRRTEITPEQCVRIDLNAECRSDVPVAEPFSIGDQSLAMIMFTSGSSGDPKGVMLSDSNLLANTESILNYLPITQDDRALVLLPFYHAFGHSILQTHLLSGATIIVDGNMAFPNTVVDALERNRATSFSSVPEGYYSLLSMSDLRERELPHLNYMSVAGGALKPDSVVDVVRGIEPAKFFVMYGQTEASARLSFLPAPLAQTRPDSIGIAIPGVQLRVFDRDGLEAKSGVTGELCARGANVMLGYWNDPQGTQHVLADGWLRTGDLASRDENGFFYVKARKNDLIKVQGFRIHPREVEDAICPHFPNIRMIVVPYHHDGVTRLALFAITNQNNANFENEVRSVCARVLPRHKIPAFVEVRRETPLNASMKLDRPALKRHAERQAQLAEEQTADDQNSKRLSA